MSSFKATQAMKIGFTIFQNEKPFVQPIKTKRSKSRKIEIFPKGLTHAFGRKMAIFPCLFFRQYRPGKFISHYSRTKKTPTQPRKKRSSKSRKSEIFQNWLTHGFVQKMAIFPCLLFLQYRPRKFVLQYSRTKKRLSSL